MAPLRGLIQILRERGIDVRGMKLNDLRAEIDTHADFHEEKSLVETFINGRGHGCIMLPKLHCELNSIEQCWAQAKCFCRSHCNYSLPGLRMYQIHSIV